MIFNILDLLELMEEGLNYIKEKIMELNKEATVRVLSDTLAAFSTIETAMLPMVDELEENEIIQISLQPAFKSWKEEIELRIRPYVES